MSQPLRATVIVLLAAGLFAACGHGPLAGEPADGPSATAAGPNAVATSPWAPEAEPRTCNINRYPERCDAIGWFECGFDAVCQDGAITARWHEHVFCGGLAEQIQNYSCTTVCPRGCKKDVAYGWPEDGQQLIEMYCN